MSLFDLLFSKKPTINQNSDTINAVPRPSKGEYYAVIDTETTWSDELMSIGIVTFLFNAKANMDTSLDAQAILDAHILKIWAKRNSICSIGTDATKQ